MDELSYLLAGYQRKNWAVFEGLFRAYLRMAEADERQCVLIATQTSGMPAPYFPPSIESMHAEPMLPEPPEDKDVLYCKRYGRKVIFEWKS